MITFPGKFRAYWYKLSGLLSFVYQGDEWDGCWLRATKACRSTHIGIGPLVVMITHPNIWLSEVTWKIAAAIQTRFGSGRISGFFYNISNKVA